MRRINSRDNGDVRFYLSARALYRAVAAYLKVVRRRKPSSAEGMRGGRAREGGSFPISLGGFGGPPPRIFLNFERFYVRFNGVLCVWDQILVVLVTKIFLVARETECWTKLFSDSHMLFFCFFSSACFFDITCISSLSPQV